MSECALKRRQWRLRGLGSFYFFGVENPSWPSWVVITPPLGSVPAKSQNVLSCFTFDSFLNTLQNLQSSDFFRIWVPAKSALRAFLLDLQIGSRVFTELLSDFFFTKVLKRKQRNGIGWWIYSQGPEQGEAPSW